MILLMCLGSCLILGIYIQFSQRRIVTYDSIAPWLEKYNISIKGIDGSLVGHVVKTSTWLAYAYNVTVCLLFMMNYFIIFIFYHKYKKYIKNHLSIMSSSTLELNRRIMKILLFQCFTPLIISGIPIFIVLNLMLFKKLDYIQSSLTILSNFPSLTPTINGFLFLVLSKKNRRGLFDIVKEIFNK
uniref:G_PROTEIN_RECEP_F1_2 domain-containing protein n=1 Tax=Parastrongyloides trichosuri TaxID=131310 RepID=A0A0N4ZZI3_PARTI